MIVLRSIMIFAGCLASMSSFAQGGVDVKYIDIDSVDNTFIGRAVKIDFKGSVSHDDEERPWIWNVSGDSTKLLLDGRQTTFTEEKGRGVDYYYFSKEFLESKTYSQPLLTRIYSCTIRDIKGDSILFQLILQLYRKSSKTKLEYHSEGNKEISYFSYDKKRKETETVVMAEVESRKREMWIRRDRIDGVLIRTY